MDTCKKAAPAEIVIDLGNIELYAKTDTSFKSDGDDVFKVNAIHVCLRHKSAGFCQDIALIRPSQQQTSAPPESIDCVVWANEWQEKPTNQFVIPVNVDDEVF